MAATSTLKFEGETSDIEKAFQRVSAAANDMADSVESASREIDETVNRMDAVGEAAGTVDTRAMGFRDTITGLQDTFRGLSDDSLSLGDRLFTLGAGIGDLASGVENLGAPLVKAAQQHAKSMATMIANNARAVASAVTSSARIAAAWSRTRPGPRPRWSPTSPGRSRLGSCSASNPCFTPRRSPRRG